MKLVLSFPLSWILYFSVSSVAWGENRKQGEGEVITCTELFTEVPGIWSYDKLPAFVELSFILKMHLTSKGSFSQVCVFTVAIQWFENYFSQNNPLAAVTAQVCMLPSEAAVHI